MKTLLEIISLSEGYLQKKGIHRPRREAEDVIADVLGLKRLDLYLHFERPLVEEELSKCRLAIQRRGEGEPAFYISGKISFAQVTIHVNRSVLIPRPETEILVEKIASTLSKLPLEGKVLWDVCTGSGCIGIALKKRFPQLKVILSDASSEALAVAKENASRNLVDVQFFQGDLFLPFIGSSCDFFVSNPPYVSKKEYAALSKEVHYEPQSALVSGETGLEFYQRIAKDLPHFLSQNGKGWMEIGARQGEEVKKIFKQTGFHSHFEPDWAGHDRFFFLERDGIFNVS